MPKYNHMYSIAFSVVSDDPDGNDVTAPMLFCALMGRLRRMMESGQNWEAEMLEGCGCPEDTYEEDDE